MGRTGIESIEQDLARLSRKIARYKTAKDEDPQRRARTRHLIQLGGVAVKVRPEITVEELERMLTFLEEEFAYETNLPQEERSLTNFYQTWKAKYMKRKK